MPARPLFVYGTLRDPEVLALVLGRVLPAGSCRAAMAPGCAAADMPGRNYPGLRREANSAAPGMLIEGLGGTDLARLDCFEGGEYARGPVEVIVNGVAINADVYWPVRAIDAAAPEWVLADWVERHKPAFLAAETEALSRQRPPRP